MLAKAKRELVGDTEPWFKQRVVELMNNIIRARSLAFERAEAEQSVHVQVGRYLDIEGGQVDRWQETHVRHFDGVLCKRSGQEAVCEMEFKRPHIEAADFDLVNNAAQNIRRRSCCRCHRGTVLPDVEHSGPVARH